MEAEKLLDADMWTKMSELVISYGIKFIIAIAIFVIGKWLANKVAGFIESRMSASKVDATVSKFVKNIIYYILLVVVIIAALGQLGVQTASFIAIVGAAGLAVGFALQGSLANFAAGVLLILFRPIKVGDLVEVAGVLGTVNEIAIFATTLLTGDNKTITIANDTILKNTIVNFSTQPTRRVDLTVGVSYDSDLTQVKKELQALADSDERILDDPAPTIGVVALADSSINFVFRTWVKSADYWPVYFDLNEKIKNRFDEVGIGIPFPTMDLNVEQVKD